MAVVIYQSDAYNVDGAAEKIDFGSLSLLLVRSVECY